MNPSGAVLTAAFLMNLPQTAKNTESLLQAIREMTDEDFKVWKKYQENGSFICE